jgi:hypothetical protein
LTCARVVAQIAATKGEGMVVVLGILGVFQILAGIGAEAASKSAIQEIIAAVCFGFGVLAIGLAAVVNRLEKLQS